MHAGGRGEGERAVVGRAARDVVRNAVQRVFLAPDLFHVERGSVLRHGDRPARLVGPDVDVDGIFAHRRIILVAVSHVVACGEGLECRGVGGPVLLDLVHVVGDELLFDGKPRGFVLPFEVGSVDREDLVTRGRTVGADVVVAVLLRPPPGAADRGDVLLVDVGIGRRLDIAVHVRVPRDESHVAEAGEAAQDFVDVSLGLERYAHAAASAVRVKRAVASHDDRGRFVDMGELLLEPSQLPAVEAAVVVARTDRTLRAARVEVLGVVEHDVVYPADVHGVVNRAHVLAVGAFGAEIGGYIGVVVVVAHHRPHLEVEVLDALLAFGQRPLVVVPVAVPREVAQVEAVYLSGCGGVVGRCQLLDEAVGELNVIFRGVAVGQVHVRGHEHGVGVVVGPEQLEVELFDGVCVERAGLPELGHRLDGGDVIARRQDDEGEFVAFFGIEPIETVGVGLGDQVSVRDQDVGDALSCQVDDTLDRRALLVRYGDAAQGEVEFGGAQCLLFCAALQGEFTVAVGGVLGNGKGQRRIVSTFDRRFEFPPPLLQ